MPGNPATYASMVELNRLGGSGAAGLCVLAGRLTMACGGARDTGSTGQEPPSVGPATDDAGAGTASAAGEGAAEDEGGDRGGEARLDVEAATGGTGGAGDCPGGGGGGEVEFSYLWAANSGQGTISKIDTQTLTELGRYLTSADGKGSPSRTSVSLTGDVAVANRNGGVTKVYASIDDCVDRDGSGVI